MSVPLLLALSCSSYGWADRDNEHTADQALRIAPITAPAHLALDLPLLRELLLDELRLHGVRPTTSSDSPTLTCMVSPPDNRVHGPAVTSGLAVGCRLEEASTDRLQQLFQAKGLAVEGLGDDPLSPSANRSATMRSDTAAAVDAFRRLAPQIADALHLQSP